jgi:Fasciclin domain
MGLTAQQLAERPELVGLLLAYHFVPGTTITPSQVATGRRVAATGDANYLVSLTRSPDGRIIVTDAQGRAAKAAAAAPARAGAISVYVIDRVLMSGADEGLVQKKDRCCTARMAHLAMHLEREQCRFGSLPHELCTLKSPAAYSYGHCIYSPVEE